MVYNVSTFVSKTEGKNCYAVEKEGRLLSNKIFSFEGENIKDNILNCVYQGLKSVGIKVCHEDVIVITVQNAQVVEWLNGLIEHKGYTDWLDKIFDVIESLDCRYRFMYSKEPLAKKYSKGKGKTTVKVSSLDDLMSEFE